MCWETERVNGGAVRHIPLTTSSRGTVRSTQERGMELQNLPERLCVLLLLLLWSVYASIFKYPHSTIKELTHSVFKWLQFIIYCLLDIRILGTFMVTWCSACSPFFYGCIFSEAIQVKDYNSRPHTWFWTYSFLGRSSVGSLLVCCYLAGVNLLWWIGTEVWISAILSACWSLSSSSQSSVFSPQWLFKHVFMFLSNLHK